MVTGMNVFKRMDLLLPDEAHWVKGFNALTADRKVAHTMEPTACLFCLIGAFIRANGGNQSSLMAVVKHGKPSEGYVLLEACREVAEKKGLGFEPRSAWSFNDNDATTFTDVKAVIKRADELWEAQVNA